MLEDPMQQPSTVKKSSPTWLWWLIGGGCGLLLCVAALVVGGLMVFAPVTGQVFSAISTEAPNAPIPNLAPTTIVNSHPQAKGNSMGDPNAPVKIIEYADFQCPYCLRYWQDTEPKIISTYIATGKVYYQ